MGLLNFLKKNNNSSTPAVEENDAFSSLQRQLEESRKRQERIELNKHVRNASAETYYEQQKRLVDEKLKKFEDEGININLHDSSLNPTTHVLHKKELEQFVKDNNYHVNRGGFNKESFKDAKVIYLDTLFYQIFGNNFKADYKNKIYNKLINYLKSNNYDKLYVKLFDQNFLVFEKDKMVSNQIDYDAYLIDGNAVIKNKFIYDDNGATIFKQEELENCIENAIEKIGLVSQDNVGPIYYVEQEKYLNFDVSVNERYSIKNDILKRLYISGQYENSINFIADLLYLDRDINPYLHPCLELQHRKYMQDIFRILDRKKDRCLDSKKEKILKIYNIDEAQSDIFFQNLKDNFIAFLNDKNYKNDDFVLDDFYSFFEQNSKTGHLVHSPELTDVTKYCLAFTNKYIASQNINKNSIEFNKKFGKEFHKTFCNDEFMCLLKYLKDYEGINDKNISKFKAELKISYYAYKSRTEGSTTFDYNNKRYRIISAYDDKSYENNIGAFRLEEIDKITSEPLDIIYDVKNVQEHLSQELEEKYKHFLNTFSEKYKTKEENIVDSKKQIEKIKEIISATVIEMFATHQQIPSYILFNIKNSDVASLQIEIEPTDKTGNNNITIIQKNNDNTRNILYSDKFNAKFKTYEELFEQYFAKLNIDVENSETKSSPFFEILESKIEDVIINANIPEKQENIEEEYKPLYNIEKELNSFIEDTMSSNRMLEWNISKNVTVSLMPKQNEKEKWCKISLFVNGEETVISNKVCIPVPRTNEQVWTDYSEMSMEKFIEFLSNEKAKSDIYADHVNAGVEML